MNIKVPISHLSKQQIQLVESILSSKPSRTSSQFIQNFVEVIKVLATQNKDHKILLAADPVSLSLLQTYFTNKNPDESTLAPNDNHIDNTDDYQNSYENLLHAYQNAYPRDLREQTIKQHYLVQRANFNISSTPYNDLPSTLHHWYSLSKADHNRLDEIIPLYRHSWLRYPLIDPLAEDTYAVIDDNFGYIHDKLMNWKQHLTIISEELEAGIDQLLASSSVNIDTIYEKLKLFVNQDSLSPQEITELKRTASTIIKGIHNKEYHEIKAEIIKVLENWNLVQKDLKAQLANKFNKNNTDSADLSDITQELNELLLDLKNDGIIKLEQEVFPLNYGQQLLLARVLCSNVEFATNWIEEQHDYIKYKVFCKTCNPNALKFLIAINEYPHNKRLSIINRLKLQCWIDDKINNLIPLTHQIEERFFDAFYVFSENQEYQNVYLQDLQTKGHDADLVFHFENEQFILTYQPQERIDATSKLLDKDIYNIQAIHTLKADETHSQSKRLAKAIFSVNSAFRIFQTRTHNILSFLIPSENDILVDLLANQGIKELIQTNVLTNLIECLLTANRQQILLIDDQLIDVYHPESYLWQRQLIQCLEKSGFQIVSVNTTQILSGTDLDQLLIQYLGIDTASKSLQIR